MVEGTRPLRLTASAPRRPRVANLGDLVTDSSTGRRFDGLEVTPSKSRPSRTASTSAYDGAAITKSDMSLLSVLVSEVRLDRGDQVDAGPSNPLRAG